MAERRDNPKQDPAEGSRDIIDRELKRQGDSRKEGNSGEPGSAGRTSKPDGQDKSPR